MFNILRRFISKEIIFNLLSWIVVLILLGVLRYIDMESDWGRVLTPHYATEAGTLFFSGILIFAITLYNKFINYKETDERTKRKEEQVHSSLDKVNTNDLSPFIVEENVERRVKTYTHNKEREYENLLSKIAKKHSSSLETWVGNCEESKKQDNWCVKLQSIERELDKDFVENNKRHLPARFVRITPNYITSGVNKKNKNQSDIENPSDGVAQAVKDNAINFIIPLLFTMAVFATTITTRAEDFITFLGILCIKFLFLLIQRFSAVVYSEKFYKLTWVYDIELRYRLVLKFLNWKVKPKGGKNNAIEQQQPESPRRETRDADKLQSQTDSTSSGV